MSNRELWIAVFQAGLPTLAALVGMVITNRRMDELQRTMDRGFDAMEQALEAQRNSILNRH